MNLRQDYAWLNDVALTTLSRGYLRDGIKREDLKQAAIDRIEAIVTHAETMLNMKLPMLRLGVKRGWVSPASPVWSNFGAGRGLPISCNGSYMADDMDSILWKVAEVGMMTKEGAGTSVYMGALRPFGSQISGGGKSEGPKHFARLIQEDVQVISQSNVRRGNAAIYLDIEHGDVERWLQIRSISGGTHDEIQHLSFGLCIGDEWMNEMLAEPKGGPKRSLMAKIRNKRRETGFPYLFFRDAANRGRPEVLKKLGLKIHATNLCVGGDSRILTDKGHVRIVDLVDTKQRVWNGEEWSDVTIHQTGSDQELIEVVLSDGRSLRCTPYHKFYVQNEYGSAPVEVRAGMLKPKMKLIKMDLPIIEGVKSLEKAYTNGFFSGDGCGAGTSDRIDLYGQKMRLKDYIEHDGRWGEKTKSDGLNLAPYAIYAHVKGLQQKFFVPGASYTVAARLTWLAGLLDSDGTVARNGENESLQLASINPDFLRDVQDMLQTLGVNAKVTLMRDYSKRLLPNGLGGKKEYECKPLERLIVSSGDTQRLLGLGLACRRLNLTKRNIQRDAVQFATIASVTEYPGYHDTFCFTEPKRHMGVFNGILTGNCTEIMLPSTPDESFVCDLSSVNLLYYDEWKNTSFVREMVFLLDAVMSEYIEKTNDIRLLADANRFAKRWRAVGLGVLGYHSMLQAKGIPFESFEARRLNIKVHHYIQSQADHASEYLAQRYGEPEGMRGTGHRNLTRMAIAPTTSSSIICGQVSQSIEPWDANIFENDNAKGVFTQRNKQLEELLEEKGMNTTAVWGLILQAGGSVQSLDFLSEREKAVFKTFAEIDQMEIIEQAADRQVFIDQGQSLNIKLAPEASMKEDVELIVAAWRLGLKSLYYRRGFNKAQELARQNASCVSCEA